MPKRKLLKPMLGIDQLSDETSLLHDTRQGFTAVREATNVDIDVRGNVNRRTGYTIKQAGSNFHSLYKTKRGRLLVCNSEQICAYAPSSDTLYTMGTFPASQHVSYTELNGNVYFTSPSNISGMLHSTEQTIRPLGVSLPYIEPVFTGHAGGGDSGDRLVAYSIVNDLGEESPLSELTQINGSGIVANNLIIGYRYRIYATSNEGEELYQVDEFVATSTSHTTYYFEEGRRPLTKDLSLLPHGYTIRTYGGRLYIATNNFVYYSEAFLPHLTNLGNNFLPTTGFTYMLQPVDTGIFIGDQAGVKFYQGGGPSDFKVMDVSTEVPVFGTSIAVPGEYLPEKLGEADTAAVWLTRSGYQVGLSTGTVVRLHKEQVHLPQYVQGCTAFSTLDGRKQVITPVNSNVLTDDGVAIDSVIT